MHTHTHTRTHRQTRTLIPQARRMAIAEHDLRVRQIAQEEEVSLSVSRSLFLSLFHSLFFPSLFLSLSLSLWLTFLCLCEGGTKTKGLAAGVAGKPTSTISYTIYNLCQDMEWSNRLTSLSGTSNVG